MIKLKEFDFWFTYLWKGKTEDYIGCKQSWKAALEWALDMSGDIDIINKIYKELDG